MVFTEGKVAIIFDTTVGLRTLIISNFLMSTLQKHQQGDLELLFATETLLPFALW
ncbi:hypothetical protein GCM10008018_61440 [Paenibacillus marchantiophytorum]|uniref:Uncharacterized protein n=1 Tax=Paenibacillus marchantiophytorum TaxID=1619310 RepID=A0ABQ1FF26_9BACL|nr:hypothetical protein GCM10008018_61440 [Paenibacillus marchantiophytorum]